MKITKIKLSELVKRELDENKLDQLSSYEKWLIILDNSSISRILDIYPDIPGGDDFDAPGYYQDEKGKYASPLEFFEQNLGIKTVKKLEKYFNKNKSNIIKDIRKLWKNKFA
jgi:hypothetical protein